MSFGEPGPGAEWLLDEEAARAVFRQALDLGITFWDTANVYGASEEIIGRAVASMTRRDDMVLATKLALPVHEGPGGSGTSRKAVIEQVESSLRRLGTDYIDLYQIHRLDPETPMAETMEALHEVVKAGKVRYLGASSMWAWQFQKMQHIATVNGWTPFISMQNQYNLIHREEEREMFPLLRDQGVGAIPWSPLGAGVVARPWGEKGTARGSWNPETDQYGNPLFLDSDRAVVDAVEKIANERGISMATVAIAWVLNNPTVSAPIIGATKPHHLTDAAASLEVKLTTEELNALERPYVPRQPTYFD